MPIFEQGKIVAFAAVVSHMPDIGGRIRNAGIRDIYEEGLQIPPLKLISGGRPDQNLLDMIGQNVRVLVSSEPLLCVESTSFFTCRGPSSS